MPITEELAAIVMNDTKATVSKRMCMRLSERSECIYWVVSCHC
jgi:hypothetical protein